METDAFQLPDDLFLATHYPMKVYFDDSKEGGGIPVQLTEQEILYRFLAPDDYCLVVVLGSAGSGKSHLIRWMSANIPASEKRKVIRVPKSGISLRKVIELILDQVEGQQFNTYRERLEKATGNLTPHQAREMLLNDLALAAGPNGMTGQGTLTEIEEYLIRYLPSFLYDNHFRQFLLRDNGIIDELVEHVLGSNEQVDRREERRGFKVSDLPLNLSDIEKAGAAARDFYSNLVIDKEIQNAAVDWLNKCLNEAISRLLNFSGNDLMELMFDVRKELAKQDIELVILIEDLARLQGIDSQLLDALLERRIAADGTKLCVMRTAFAATTGFFERSVDTTRHRLDFRVYLDLPDKRSWMNDDDMLALTSLYLNAVRMSSDKISEWYLLNVKEGSTSAITNACLECEYRDKCHTAFGSINGTGLYPFTKTAIAQMFGRVTDKGMNPRLLIMDVLKHTLNNYGEHILNGEFPPPALLQHFKGSKMSALMLQELERRDMKNGNRRQVLIELWTDSSELVNLHPGIHEAFALPMLSDLPEATSYEIYDGETETVNEPKEPQIVKKETQLPDKLIAKLQQLDQWLNGGGISQNLAQELRELLFSAIVDFIDWDANLILKSEFVGNGKPFQQKGISFLNQSTQEGKTRVPLKVPLNGEIKTEDVLALQGIILYNHFKHWRFPNAEKYFLAYADRLEEWSNYVLHQLRNSSAVSQEWDPVPTLVESIVIALLMSGSKVDWEDNVSLISCMFSEPENVDNSMRTKKWQDLYSLLDKNYSKLIGLLKSWVGCTKGQRDAQMIDAARLIKPINDLRKNGWMPVNKVPNDVRADYRIIGQVHNKVNESLKDILHNEYKSYLERVKAFGEALDGQDNKEVVKAVKEVIEQTRSAGVAPFPNFDSFIEVINKFDRTEPQPVFDLAKKLETLKNEDDLLPLLGQIDLKTVATIDEFIYSVNELLNKIERRLETEEANLGSDVKLFVVLQDEISQILDDMQKVLDSKMLITPQESDLEVLKEGQL